MALNDNGFVEKIIIEIRLKQTNKQTESKMQSNLKMKLGALLMPVHPPERSITYGIHSDQASKLTIPSTNISKRRAADP